MFYALVVNIFMATDSAVIINRVLFQEILEHQRRRRVEVKCAELEDLMSEQGYDEAEIEEKVTEYRKLLLNKLEKEGW